MRRRVACRYCGAGILVMTCFDSVIRSFNAAAATDTDTPPELRWYVHRTRGAINGAVADAPADRDYLTLHFCNEYALTADGTDADAAGSILERPGVRFTNTLDLTGTGHRLMYRWPGSWAHIVRIDRGLCGARVAYPVEGQHRAANEDRGMPTCPDCLQVFESRRRRAS